VAKDEWNTKGDTSKSIGMAKATSQAEVTSKSKKIKPALSYALN